VLQAEQTTELQRLQALFEVIYLPQNRKFQDFVESKYMADDSVGSAELIDDSVGNSALGAVIPKHIKVTYDFDVDGGGQGALPIGGGTQIPDNAIITNCYFELETTITSGGSATIALGYETNTDAFIGATAYNNAAFTGTVSAKTNDLPIKTSAAHLPLVTIATADLTAGKFSLYIEYIEGA